MLTRWRRWPLGLRWVIGALGTFVLAMGVDWLLFVPIAGWLATHDVGQDTGAVQLQTAKDAVRGLLLTFGAALFAAGALIFTARNFAVVRDDSRLATPTLNWEAVNEHNQDEVTFGLRPKTRFASLRNQERPARS